MKRSGIVEILIVGIGSRLMMDDGIGVYLVEGLEQLETNPIVKYAVGETDVDYCIAEMFNSDYLIIIDAFLSGNHPGEITVTPLSDLRERNNDGCYSLHGMHLIEILRYAKHMPDGILIGIEPYEINYGFDMSDMLQSCYQDILEAVQERVNEYIELWKGQNA